MRYLTREYVLCDDASAIQVAKLANIITTMRLQTTVPIKYSRCINKLLLTIDSVQTFKYLEIKQVRF